MTNATKLIIVKPHNSQMLLKKYIVYKSQYILFMTNALNFESRHSLTEFDKTMLIAVNKLSKRVQNSNSKVNRCLRGIIVISPLIHDIILGVKYKI